MGKDDQHIATVSPYIIDRFTLEFGVNLWECKKLTPEQIRWLRDERTAELARRNPANG